ncbi:MAG: hypothetical protein SGJ20_12970 [Planctomycetota bacterium]|nr:hypothetical protein [Planctomycetota bacterium]
MQSFIQRHAAHVIGVLSGFDRVRLRGTLRWLSNTRGMYGFLQASSVLLKDLTQYAKDITEQIRQLGLGGRTARRSLSRPVRCRFVDFKPVAVNRVVSEASRHLLIMRN